MGSPLYCIHLDVLFNGLMANAPQDVQFQLMDALAAVFAEGEEDGELQGAGRNGRVSVAVGGEVDGNGAGWGKDGNVVEEFVNHPPTRKRTQKPRKIQVINKAN
eukprot:TRINITY_DN11299_c0_g1_i1.p1 TRINITY_DN11299_c0_g1~~TRINITY_DN11299_c0_g1_i1.p1  ORF type:complete len:104 (-),score=29.08 TRINITY_DN11299_c0_g1_i1:56-367(-)